MKKQIWKFQLSPSIKQTIEMPIGAEILSVQGQADQGCIWALVDPDAEKEERIFEVYGTGHDINYDMGVDRKHIGTFQVMGGTLIFHVFERIN